jgi:predicted histidine transporter YuiF (NhaC family)
MFTAEKIITVKEVSDLLLQVSMAIIVMCIAAIYLTYRKKRDAAREAVAQKQAAAEAERAAKIKSKPTNKAKQAAVAAKAKQGSGSTKPAAATKAKKQG